MAPPLDALARPAVTRIYLVRHGETDWNRLSLHQGTTDVPLNARGREQARRLAASLRHVHFLAAYTSPLQRARETAEVITRGRGVPVVRLSDLREISYGLWQGKSADWWRRACPALARRWRTDPWAVRFPGGETLGEVRERVGAALRRILDVHPGGTVLVCGHGHVNRVLLIDATGRSPQCFWAIEQPNGGCRMLQVRAARTTRGADSATTFDA